MGTKDRSYGVLGSEIWDERIRAKINVDYYGAMAAWRRFWIVFFNGVALITSGSAAVVIIKVSEGNRWIAVALALAASVASVVSALSPWSDEQAKFLRAQEEYRKQEVRWDILWHRLYAHEYSSLDDSWREYEELKGLDAAAEQIAQPHRQRARLVRKIQNRLEKTSSTGTSPG